MSPVKHHLQNARKFSEKAERLPPFLPQAETGLRAREHQHKGWTVTLVMCHNVVFQVSFLQPLGSKVGYVFT